MIGVDPAVTARRLHLLAGGYTPLPVAGKAVYRPEWKTIPVDEAEVLSWEAHPDWPGIGIRTGTIVGVDIDVDDAALAEKVKALALRIMGKTTLVRVGRAPRMLLVYRTETPYRKKVALGVAGKVEALGDGQQFVAYGIHPDTQKPYTWTEADLLDVPAAHVPLIGERALDVFLAAALEALGGLPPKAAQKPVSAPYRANGHDTGTDTTEVLDALYAIPGSLEYDEWVRVGMALWSAMGPAGEAHWMAWSARSPKNQVAVTIGRWRSFHQVRDIKPETLFWFARESGWKPDREKSRSTVADLEVFKARKYSDTPDANGEFKPIDESAPSQPAALPRIHLRDIRSPLPPDRLIRKLLGTETLAMIYGPSGSGKSFLAMDMGLHVAMERDWFGRKVMKGAVLYVAAEGAAGINNRIIGFKKKYMPDENTPFDLVPVALNLGPNGQDADKVIAAVGEMEAETGLPVLLIVIDTLARAMGNGDENTAKDMGEFVGHCDRIKQATKATILIVHHTGKNQSAGARGSSSLPAAVDTTIEVEVGDGGRIATIVKQKDGEDGVKFGFDLEVVEIGFDDDGEPITTCVVYTTDALPKPSSKLSPQMRRAMEVLTSTIAQRNVQPPNRVDFPSVSVALLEHWRNELRETGITDRNDKAKERASFSRIRQTLDQKGFIRMRGEYVWKCETTETVRNKTETKK